MDFTSRTKLKSEIIIYAGYFSVCLSKHNINRKKFKFPLFSPFELLTFAGGQDSGFSPRLRSTTEFMNRSSTGSVVILLALKSM